MKNVVSASRYGREASDVSLSHFSLKKEKFLNSKVCGSYLVGEFQQPNYLAYASIDQITFYAVDLSCTNFFGYFLAHGITSPLIVHFNKCLENDEPLILPNSKTQTKVITPNRVNLSKTDSRFNSKNQTQQVSILSIHGFENFKAILNFDKFFFLEFFRAVEQNLCTINRMDLCMDFSADLMLNVSASIIKGTFQGFGTHLRGFGTSGGSFFEKKRLGHETIDYKNLTANAKVLIVDTLYIGTKEMSAQVITIYNKHRQKAHKFQQYIPPTSRFEVRLDGSVSSPYSQLIPWLMLATSVKGGFLFIQIVFVAILFTFTRVTTNKKLPVQNTYFSDFSSWASWWVILFEVCIQPLLVPTDKNTLLESFLQLFETLFFQVTREKDPQKVFDLFKNFYLARVETLTMTQPLFFDLDLCWLSDMFLQLPDNFSSFVLNKYETGEKLCFTNNLFYHCLQSENLVITSKEYGTLEINHETIFQLQTNPTNALLLKHFIKMVSNIPNLEQFNAQQTVSEPKILKGFWLLAKHLLSCVNNPNQPIFGVKDLQQVFNKNNILVTESSVFNLEAFVSLFQTTENNTQTNQTNITAVPANASVVPTTRRRGRPPLSEAVIAEREASAQQKTPKKARGRPRKNS